MLFCSQGPRALKQKDKRMKPKTVANLEDTMKL